MNDLQASAQRNGTIESMAGLSSQIAGLEGSIANQKNQIKLLDQQLVGMRELASEGYVARNRLLDLERTRLQIIGSLSENAGNLDRTKKQLAELNERLPDYQFQLENATIESPVAGNVINLAVFTQGQVVQAGANLMEISPENQPLLAEAKVPVNLIDKVYAGLPVEMVFSAFNQRVTPRIPGVVTVVSADRSTDERTGEVYYKIQSQVTEAGLRMLKDQNVRPGMPVEVFVITGERTMMNYLFRPLLDRIRTSMAEE
jgi:protease secretion system membrane fusion protein